MLELNESIWLRSSPTWSVRAVCYHQVQDVLIEVAMLLLQDARRRAAAQVDVLVVVHVHRLKWEEEKGKQRAASQTEIF